MSLIKGKSYICTKCGKLPGQGCVLYVVGVQTIPTLCPHDATLEATFDDQTAMVKKKLKW